MLRLPILFVRSGARCHASMAVSFSGWALYHFDQLNEFLAVCLCAETGTAKACRSLPSIARRTPERKATRGGL